MASEDINEIQGRLFQHIADINALVREVEAWRDIELFLRRRVVGDESQQLTEGEYEIFRGILRTIDVRIHGQ